MKTKAYISILLVAVFLMKFVAIEANVLNIIYSGDDIVFVDLYCKKESGQKDSKEFPKLAQADQKTLHSISVEGYCTPQFQFELASWEAEVLEPIRVHTEHATQKLSYRYLEHSSPPPRQA